MGPFCRKGLIDLYRRFDAKLPQLFGKPVGTLPLGLRAFLSRGDRRTVYIHPAKPGVVVVLVTALPDPQPQPDARKPERLVHLVIFRRIEAVAAKHFRAQQFARRSKIA